MNKIIRVTGMDIRAAEGTAMRRMAWALVFVLASGAAFGAKRPQAAQAPLGSPTEQADLTGWDAIATGALEQVPALAAAPPEPDAPAVEAIGLAPQAWRARLAELAGLRNADAVPGVDLFLSGDDERLVAVLLVKPGFDVTSVRLALPEGAEVESGAQGHVIVRLAGGDLALLRPGIVQRQDGQLVAVHGGWAASVAGLDLTLGKFDGGQPLYVRFELLSLRMPKQLERFDRNHDGRVQMQELRPVVSAAPPVPDALTVTATQADSFSVDTDADTLADPGDEIRYTVVISAAGGTATSLTFNDTPDLDTTLVGGSINVSPLARDDSYGAAGNVTLNVASAASGLFANDNDFLGDTFTLTTPAPNVATPTTGGGTITIQADGTFAYTTPPGASSGTDTFTYTLTDTGGLTGTGTVTFNISGKVWFVDRDAPGGGTGTQASPFNVLSPTTVAGVGGSGDVDGANDIIYLYDRAAATDYTGGLELEAGQRLVGSGVALIVGGTTILPATTPPVLVNTGGNALTLIAGATVDARPHVEGITINAANNAAIAGSGALGTITLDAVTVNTSGTGSGLSLTNQTGTLTVTNGAFGGTGSGGAVVLSGGAGSVTLTGAPISKTGGRLVDVQSKTGGTVTFGSVAGTGAGTDAIVAQNNTSTTLAFPSGFSATTSAGRGLFANNGGTINVTGTTSTIGATGGAALDVTGTSFGTGLTLASASSTNSTAEGVKLSNVTGPLTINGGAISGSAATFAAFSLAQGSANVTYAGTIAKVNAGRVVDVQTRAGGTVQFGGAITASGASTGINVSGATVATTVTFSAPVDLGTSGTRLTGGTALTVNHNANASTTTFADLDVFTTGQAGISASNGGTFNISTGQVDAGGRALNLDGLAVGATFSNLISSGSSAEGVRLNAATGTLTATTTTVTNPTTQGITLTTCAGSYALGTGSITGSAGTAFNVGGGNPTVGYSGSITQNNAARVADVQTTTGGAITLGGTLTGGASSTGVNINAANGNVTFGTLNLGTSGSRMANQAVTINGGTGTYNLGAVSIFTTGGTGKGISAVNADGTISATGTVNAAGAPAVDIDGPAGLTTLGMSLTSVAANAGTYGLRVQDTDGSFVVNGDGGGSNNGSGGTLTAMTGVDQLTAADAAGNGVYLSNALGVSLRYMNITSNQNSGVFADNATNFTMVRGNVQNNGNSAGTALNEAGLRFLTLKGTNSISDTVVSGSVEDNVRVSASSGLLTELQITNGTIGPNSVATGNNGLGVFGDGSAVMTVKVNGTSFPTNKARGIAANSKGNAAVTVELSGISVNNSTGGLDFTTEQNGDLTYKVLAGSTLLFNGQLATSAVNIVTNGSDSTNASDLKGRIQNTILGNGSVDSGSIDNFGIAADLRADVRAVLAVDNNTIQHTDWEGIFVQSRLDNDADAEIGHMDLEVRDNSVGTMDDGGGGFPLFFVYGTRIESRNTSDACLDIFSNTSSGVGGAEHFRARQRDTSTFRVERLALGAQTAATMQTHLVTQNDAGSSASATVATSFTGVADGTCLTPP